MKKDFYLFRHGQTNWNLEKRCQGHTDIPLNESGLKQAEELSLKFNQIPLEVIYSSDLKRAIQTAEVLSLKKNIPLLISEHLREFCLGSAEGQSHDDLISSFGVELWENFLSINCEKNDISYPGGESRYQVLKRTMKILNTIACESSYEKIGIATHGGTLRNLLSHIDSSFKNNISTPNCCVFKICYLSTEKNWISEGQIF